jgi:hypothetical protein
MLFTDPFLLWYIFPQKIPSYKTHGSKRKKKKKERKNKSLLIVVSLTPLGQSIAV